MVQPTIHKYFHSPRPIRFAAKTTFLHLPFHVRREIYLLSGPLTNSTIYFNYIPSSNEYCIQEYSPFDRENWPTEPKITPRSQSLTHFLHRHLSWPQIHLNRYCGCKDHYGRILGYLCTCDPLPWQLLYISKPIADEVFSIFYSENHFCIFRDSIGGLSGIDLLPRTALRTIRSLEVCLNVFDPGFELNGRRVDPQRWDVWYHPTYITSKRQRMFNKAKLSYETSSIDEFKKLCRVLQTNTRPNHLKLTLTYDTIDIEIAAEILRPLSQLPLLRECAIRLGILSLADSSIVHTPLQVLAKSQVNRLTHHSFSGTFDFEALPAHIQFQILSYTSLVTPYDLIWGLNESISSTINSTFYEPRTFFYQRGPPFEPDYVFGPSHATCCGNCSPSPEICSCCTIYVAFSSTCTCWRFPISFFLVNKRMKELAEAVFYGSNHFRVLPMHRNKSKKLEIYDFLTWIPSNARRYLRSLTWEMTWRPKEERGG